MEGIAAALPANDDRVTLLRDAADRHAQMGFSYVFSGHYEGEHWLATFAIYLQAAAEKHRQSIASRDASIAQPPVSED
jgi:hypothetical protein